MWMRKNFHAQMKSLSWTYYTTGVMHTEREPGAEETVLDK